MENNTKDDEKRMVNNVNNNCKTNRNIEFCPDRILYNWMRKKKRVEVVFFTGMRIEGKNQEIEKKK